MKFYDARIWEGKYVDLWTIPHFLIGVLFAFFALIEGFSILNSFYVLVVATVFWEIFEIKFNLKEKMGNRIVDIFVAITGFYFLILLIGKWGIGAEKIEFWFYLTLAVYILVNLIGWLAYRKRRKERITLPNIPQ